jgi:SAM-dependent methyltransferase
MSRFWDERAREEPYFFIDNRRIYGDPDLAGFWAEGEADLDRLLELLGVAVEPQDRALDIGCGVGRLTRVLSGRATTVIGLDVSAAMLERARAHNEAFTNITWVHGDGVSLAQISDESIDACVSHVVFQHIPDPQVTLGYVREIGRVLAPGGWAAFQVSNDPRVHVARPQIRSLKDRLAAAVGRRPRGQGEPEWLGSAVDMNELRAVAAGAGLLVDEVVGEGTQFCLVLVRRPS